MTTALREIAARFGIEFDDSPLKQGTQSIEGALGMVKALGIAFASSELVRGIREFAENFERQASGLKDSAEQLGVTTQELQQLDHAARIGGVGSEVLSASLAVLSRQAVAAAAGSGGAAKAFHALGVSAKDVHGGTRPVADIMTDVAEGMSRVQDPAKRVALAQELLGRGGRKLLTVLHDGEGGLKALRGEIAELGGGLTDDAIIKADQYGDAMDRWRIAQDSLRSQIFNFVGPALTFLVDKFREGLANLSNLIQGTHVVQAAFGVLAAIVAAKLLPALWNVVSAVKTWKTIFSFLNGPIVAIGVLVLLIDDLITLFNGGDSAIGRFLDSMFGVGSSAATVRVCKEAWEGLKLAIHDTGQWVSRVVQSMVITAGDAAAALMGIWTSIIRPIAGLWTWLDEQLGGALTRMMDRVQAFFRPLTAFLERIGQAIGKPIKEYFSIASGIYSEGSRRSALAQATQATAPAPAARPVVSNRTTHNTITVSGVSDPKLAAREVERRLAARDRAQRDADHPLVPRD